MKKICILAAITVLLANTVQAQLPKSEQKKLIHTDTSKLAKGPIKRPPAAPVNEIQIRIETIQGCTYKLFINSSGKTEYRKGILVMGSGNDENAPTKGDLNGPAENALCSLALQNGYVAAIVQYTAGPGNADWNASATQMAGDYDKCIRTISATYGIPKTQSVVGGVSYASFMLLTGIAYTNTLNYCKGLLAPCGATGADQAGKFTIPVFSLCCKDKYEGNYCGRDLYDQIPATNAIKSKSEGITDANCTGHCNVNWTNQLYQKMVYWLQ